MKFSEKFGKRLSNTTIQHAPLMDGWTEAEYLAAGWKKVDLTTPKPEDGWRWEVGPLVENENGIHYEWTKVKLPEQTKTYSKLKVMLALTKLGIWRGVREWLD